MKRKIHYIIFLAAALIPLLPAILKGQGEGLKMEDVKGCEDGKIGKQELECEAVVQFSFFHLPSSISSFDKPAIGLQA